MLVRIIFLYLVFITVILEGREYLNIYITNDIEIRYIREFRDRESKLRFGNQFMAYFKAQWFSHKSGIPYLHSPFENDSIFQLRKVHDLLTNHLNKIEKPYHFQELKEFNSDLRWLNPKKHKNTIFYTTMGSTDAQQASRYQLHLWTKMRRDQVFLDKIRNQIQLVKPSDQIFFPPKNCKSIAVHVRKGGGYDGPLWSIQYFDHNVLKQENKKRYNYQSLKGIYQDVLKPMTSPPEQYYVDQINEILLQYPDEDFYIHIFTDDPNPEDIVERMQTKIKESFRVIFNWRKEGNKHDANIVEDFISMMNFDILIRSTSTFSVFPHVLGNYKLVVYPLTHKWIGQCLVYPKVVYEWSLDNRKVKRMI